MAFFVKLSFHIYRKKISEINLFPTLSQVFKHLRSIFWLTVAGQLVKHLLFSVVQIFFELDSSDIREYHFWHEMNEKTNGRVARRSKKAKFFQVSLFRYFYHSNNLGAMLVCTVFGSKLRRVNMDQNSDLGLNLFFVRVPRENL
jgi:hypothetical protein